MLKLNPFWATPTLAAITRHYAWALPVIAVLSTSVGLLEAVGVGCLIPFLSTLTHSSSAVASGPIAFVIRLAGSGSQDEKLFRIAGVILACVVIKDVFQVFANVFVAWIQGRIAHDVRCSLSTRLQGFAYEFFVTNDSSRLVNVLTVQSRKILEAVHLILASVSSGSIALAFAALLLIVSWKLMAIVLAGGLAARFVQKKGESRLRRLSTVSGEATQKLVDRMLFLIFGARLVRIFHQEKNEHVRFEEASNRLRRADLRVDSLFGTLWPFLEVLQGLLFLAVLLSAVFFRVSFPVLAAFLVLMNRLQPHLRTLEQSRTAFASATGQLIEVEWLLDAGGKPSQSSGTLPFSGLESEIQFQAVGFRYPERSDLALTDADFTIRRGRSTALIGASGAGKSTILNLLCRLIEPSSGSILVDGSPLSSLKRDQWLNVIGFAGQDVDLVDGTIADNIAFGNANLHRSEMEEAARLSRADFIQDLPAGFDSLVGSRGLSLSGGQRQRIGIARALARKPQILILDEATNAVDQETENTIVRMLESLPKSMTIIVISHRPSTIAFCDDAIVLADGRVVEEGPLSSIQAFRYMRQGALPI